MHVTALVFTKTIRLIDEKSNLTMDSNSSSQQHAMNEQNHSVNNDSEETQNKLHLITNTKKHFIFYIYNKTIAMKVLKSKNPSMDDIRNLDNELEVAKSIAHPAFRSSIERTNLESKEVLLLQFAPGIPTSQLEKVPVKDFLLMAREIASSLFAMHMNRLMHTNLNCSHVMFDVESKSIKIIGCGSSTSFDNKPKYLSNQDLLEKDLR